MKSIEYWYPLIDYIPFSLFFIFSRDTFILFSDLSFNFSFTPSEEWTDEESKKWQYIDIVLSLWPCDYFGRKIHTGYTFLSRTLPLGIRSSVVETLHPLITDSWIYFFLIILHESTGDMFVLIHNKYTPNNNIIRDLKCKSSVASFESSVWAFFIFIRYSFDPMWSNKNFTDSHQH